MGRSIGTTFSLEEYRIVTYLVGTTTGATNPRPARPARLLAASLVDSALLLSAPVPAVHAACPVCATSKHARVDLSDHGPFPRPVRLWAKVCQKDSTLSIELRQQYMGPYSQNVPAIDTELRVTVYSTTSNGRFLKDVEFTDTRWVGDVTSLFPVGTTRFGRISYKNSIKLDDLRIPVLRPGIYAVGFEVVADHPGDDVPAASSTVKYLKFKV